MLELCSSSQSLSYQLSLLADLPALADLSALAAHCNLARLPIVILLMAKVMKKAMKAKAMKTASVSKARKMAKARAMKKASKAKAMKMAKARAMKKPAKKRTQAKAKKSGKEGEQWQWGFCGSTWYIGPQGLWWRRLDGNNWIRHYEQQLPCTSCHARQQVAMHASGLMS